MSVYAKYNYPSKLYKSSDDLDSQLLYMSPFDKTEPPVIPNSMGNYLVNQNMTRRSIQTNGPVGNPKALIFVPSSRSSVNALVYDLTTGVVEANSHLFSTLVKYATADPPTQIKCLRAGFKISNTSNQTDRSSTVAILQISSPIKFDYVSTVSLDLTTACAADILSMVRTHPRSKIYTAEQLCTNDNCLVVAPATSSAYSSYGDELFISPLTDANSKLAFTNAQKDMGMNNVIILFETAAAINDYLITLQTQDAMRFPAYTLLGQLQKPGIVAKDKNRIETTHKGVQEHGAQLVDLTKLSDKQKQAGKTILTAYRKSKRGWAKQPAPNEVPATRMKQTGKKTRGDYRMAPYRQKPIGS